MRKYRKPTQARTFANGYRFKLIVPYTQDRFYTSLANAKAAMRRDVEKYRDMWVRMHCKDDVDRCNKVLERIVWLDGDGGRVSGYLDVSRTVRYRAEIVVLEEPERPVADEGRALW